MQFITWIKSKYKYWVLLGYLIIIALFITIILQRHMQEKQQLPPSAPTVNLEEPLKRIEQLERQLELQKNTTKQQETANEALANSIKQLEKRVQAHTEVVKRMCEYIVIITVDKKILPRQCLPDYSWRREEGL